MSVEELEAEILKLPRDIRERLARRLISSLDVESEVEGSWVEEAKLRYEKFQDGHEGVASVSEVLLKLRKDL